MDAFPADELVFCVAAEPAPKLNPVVILIGRGAQALADDVPQLSAILESLGVRQRRLDAYSRHAEALLLHVPDEPARSISWHYEIALRTIVDLWDTETPTKLCTGPIKPRRQRMKALLARLRNRPLVARPLHPFPSVLFAARFPPSGEPPAAIVLAQWLCAFGRYGKARAILEDHLKENPDDGAAHLAIGKIQVDLMREPSQGVAHLRRAAELIPDTPDVWNLFGIALSSLGDAAAACAAFRREATLTDDFGAWMNVATQALASGDVAQARAAATRAQEKGTDAHLLYLLSVLARREGDVAAAERMLARAERSLQGLPFDERQEFEAFRLKIVAEARGTPSSVEAGS